MTDWRDNLRPASFRGVEFEVLDNVRPIGRKVAEHEFTLRTGSKGEDLGGVTKRHAIEAYVIGAEYMDQRDKLEAALNAPGRGRLVLPWTGAIQVRLMPGGRVRESDEEGGIARYQLEFMEETDEVPLIQRDDTPAMAEAAADNLHAAAQGDLVDSFTVDGKPEFVTTAAADIIGKFSDQVDALIAPLKAGADALNGYVGQAMALRAAVFALVAKPISLASQVSGLIRGIRNVAATPADALTALKVLFGFGSDLKPVFRATPARIQQADNQAVLVAFVRQSAAAEAVKALTEIDFDAYQDAVAARDDMADVLDEIAVTAADAGRDEVWRAIEHVRLAVIRDINARGASLARLYAYTPQTSLPAIVLAHRLYEDVSSIEAMAADIVARNDVVHPGFVRGGIALEVLTDVGN